MREKSQTLTKRALGVMMTVIMMLSVVMPAAPVFAAGKTDKVITQQINGADVKKTENLDPEEKAKAEYAKKKAEKYDDVVEENGFSFRKFFGSRSSGYIRNEYIEAYIGSEGHYTMGTVEGDPESDTDNNKLLLFGHPNSTTTETMIYIDGVGRYFDDYVRNVSFSADGKKCVATAFISGVEIKQILTIITNPFTGFEDLVSVRYEYTNTGESPSNSSDWNEGPSYGTEAPSADGSKQVGVRIMMDTMLGDNDGSPFRINGEEVTREREYIGNAVPQYWQSFDSLEEPNVTSTGFFFFSENEKPDKVQFADWPDIRGSNWNYCIDENDYITNDSAVAAYFYPRTLPAGSTGSVVTYYGISGFAGGNSDLDGDLGVRVTSPAKMNVSEDGGYANNPFVVSVYANNRGARTLENVKAVLSINNSQQLILDESQASTVTVGDLYGGNGTSLQWRLRALPQQELTNAEYKISFYEGNTLIKEMPLSIELASLKKEEVYKKVTFDLNGADGTAPEAQEVVIGTTVTKPADPARDGYSFGGWYSNKACTGSSWFNTFNNFKGELVTRNITLYAKWISSENAQKVVYGKDTYNFINSDYDFHDNNGGDYVITGDYYDALLDGLTNAEKANVIDMMHSYWGGSCFGMSSVLSLVKAGKLDTEFFQGDAEKLYDFDRPADNSVITNLIDFYQIIQITDITGAARSDYDRYNETANNKRVIEALEESNYPVVLGFDIRSGGWRIGGHAVVAYGFEETEAGYSVSIWDPNDKDDPNTLNISKDYTTSEFEDIYDDGYTSYIKYALTVEDGYYDYKNLQQTLMAMGKTSGENLMALMGLSNARTVILETGYDSFKITDSKGNEAVIEKGTKVSGDLDISEAEYLNEIGTQLRTQYIINGEDDDEYTVEPAGEQDEYKTTLIYDNDDNGFYTSVTSEDKGKVKFLADGTVSTEYDQATQQKVVLSSNDSVTPWYSQTVEGNTAGLTVAPAADGAEISTADNTELNISARDDYNSVVFENFTFEAETQLKLSQSTENENTALLGDQSQTMGYSLSFITSGGSAIEAQTDIPSGEKATKPEDPTRGGFVFAGWYTSEECKDGEEWSFETPITENTRIYAKWLIDNSYMHKITFKAEGADDQIFYVRDGGSFADIPETPEKLCGEGEWDIKSFDNVTSDIIVNAVYKYNHTFPETPDEHVANTCTADGYDKYICTVCGEEKIKEYYALGHDMDSHYIEPQPTCTTDGAKITECSRCDYSESLTIPACHKDVDPNDGVCDLCQGSPCELVSGQTYTATEDKHIYSVSFTGYTYVYLTFDREDVRVIIYNDEMDVWDGQHGSDEAEIGLSGGNTYYICIEPGYYDWDADEFVLGEYPVEFTYSVCAHESATYYPEVKPTCTENGYTEGTKCDICGRWIGGHYEIDPQHTFTNNWEAAEEDGVTCTENGYVKVFCDKCNYSDLWWVRAKHIDKNADGKCDKCLKVINEFVLGEKNITVDWDKSNSYFFVPSVTGEYTFETFDTGYNWPYLYVYDELCREEDYLSYDRDDYENLKKVYYLKKGITYYVEIDADDECTFPVSVTYNQCKHPAEHKKSYSQQNATCLKVGYTAGVYCEYCETWISGHKTINKLAHTYNAGTVTKKATCTTAGTKLFKCTKCTATKTQSIPAAHTAIVYLPAKAATYKTTGLTAGTKCNGCKKVLTAQKTIPCLKLAQVTGIKATPATKSIKLTWNKVTGAEKYEVKYVGGGKTVVKTVTANTINLTSLKTVTNYTVTIKAIAGTNKGAEGKLTTSTAPSKTKIKSAKSSKKKTVSLAWSKVKGATRYEIQYATSKNFKSAKKTTTKSVKATVKKLKSGRKYYIRIRAYKTVNGVKVCGAWTTKTVKVK